MGKIKKSKELKKQQIRLNPVGIPSVRSLALAEDEGLILDGSGNKSTYVQTIFEQLESTTVEEKDSGLNSVSLACGDTSILNELLAHDIIKLISSFLLHPSLIIRHSAAGALRNMSGVGSEICDKMVEEDVMKPLVLLFKQKYGGEWSSGGKKKEEKGDKIDSLTEAYIQAVHLLWNLCEANERALKIFNREGLFQIISKTLNSEIYGIRVAVATAQCLNTVTEDNVEEIGGNAEEFKNHLTKIIFSEIGPDPTSPSSAHLQILCVGILLNFYNCDLTKLPPPLLLSLLTKISQTLTRDHTKALKSLSSLLPLPSTENMELGAGYKKSRGGHEEEEEGLVKEVEVMRREVEEELDGQNLALELLTNMFFVEEEGDGVEEEEEDGVGGEGNEGCYGVERDLRADFIPEVVEAFRSLSLFSSVSFKSRELPSNVVDILSSASPQWGSGPLLSKFQTLRSTALFCLQNLLPSFELDVVGGGRELRGMYGLFTTYCGSGRRAELGEALTGVVRAVLQKGIEEECSEFLEELPLGDLAIFSSLYNGDGGKTKISLNCLKIIGGLGVVLSKKEVSKLVEEDRVRMREIGTFLLSTLGESQLWRVAEGLDTIFDVFAEDSFNSVLQELGVVEKLRAFAPQFKKQIRNQRRDLGENRVIVETARDNLLRFIDYKIKHGCH